MTHSLPGLTNNLLFVAVLCDTGCKVFLNATSCEVTFDGKVILQGWQDPKHCLWHVHIINAGWMTNLKINEISPPLKSLLLRTVSTIATIRNN
jgi:hypothetical protein